TRLVFHMAILATSQTTVVAVILPTSVPSARPVEFGWFAYEGREIPPAKVDADEFLNPILAGSYPDPSVCRVGDEFFLVNSTFGWFPGIPIFKSKALVSWQQIGHVLDRPSQLDLDHVSVSEGIFAATIQHAGGLFYVVTTLVGPKRNFNFYVTATNPAGP